MSDRLFHFTCEHGYQALGNRGYLECPLDHPLFGWRVIWLTTEATPDREATGLTMNTIVCDRMRYRYIVCEPEKAYPWIGSPEREGLTSGSVADLEIYGDPEHWWITAEPTLARLG